MPADVALRSAWCSVRSAPCRRGSRRCSRGCRTLRRVVSDRTSRPVRCMCPAYRRCVVTNDRSAGADPFAAAVTGCAPDAVVAGSGIVGMAAAGHGIAPIVAAVVAVVAIQEWPRSALPGHARIRPGPNAAVLAGGATEGPGSFKPASAVSSQESVVHVLLSSQLRGPPAAQIPDRQESATVQKKPSSQPVASGTGAWEQLPATHESSSRCHRRSPRLREAVRGAA